MQDIRNQFIAIIIITLALGYVVAPIKDKPVPGFLEKAVIQKGIDIAGGAELQYRLLFPYGFKGDRKAAGQNAVEVLQNRINTKGLKEPRITTHGEDFIVVQLAGVDRDTLNDYKQLISDVGNLELKKEAPREIFERYNSTKIVPDGFEPYPAPAGIGQGDRDEEPATWIQDMFLVYKEPVITGKDMARASHDVDLERGADNWKVKFELKAEGSKKFDDAARDLFNRSPKGHIAIIIDGALESAPSVRAEAFHGEGVISGGFSGREGEQRARNLAIILRSGSLPVPIGKLDNGKPVPKLPEAENFIGPTLGQDSIMRGLVATVVSFLGVAIFMIVYYRAGGIVAVISLILNLVYLLGIMSLFGATLTLPGIAGIALTAGMAVDANILIFERMREELQKGKTLMQAYTAGHERAFVTIVDSNLTTLLAGIVLYYFGTGPVQGFAVTLAIGILTTLISVLWCGKVILGMLISRGSIREMKMMKIMAGPNYNFVRWLNVAVAGSVIVIVASMVVFGARGANNFGIDFRGGTRVVFAFSEPQKIEDVRGKLLEVKDEKGLSKYSGVEIATVAEAGQATASSRLFQLRDQTQDVDGLRRDIQQLFAGRLSHQPFEEVVPPLPEALANPRYFPSGPAGAALDVYLRDDGAFNLEEAKKNLIDKMRGVLEAPMGDPELDVLKMEGAPKGLLKIRLVISEKDFKMPDQRLSKVRQKVKELGAEQKLNLSTDPFLAEGRVGPTVAQQLKTSSVWALIVSWILMIAYIAVRFSSWRFGVAAVLALIHDALIAIGFVSVLGLIVPKSWGLSFDMNMTFVAAILTIIGYSINDTIVIYDRIRENLGIMKKETFAEIINTSVNQTLSRTILTSVTVWVTCVVLYLATATSGGGIAEFALPMIIGVISGTYSTIYIAAPICLWWYGKTKPQMA